MSTTGKLVEDLLRKPQNSLRDELVRNALAGRYHDFKTTLATPKVQLVADLERYGYKDLARQAMRGEYDDPPDADDNAELGKMLASDPSLAELWEKMQGTDKVNDVLGMISEHLRKHGEPPKGTT